MKGVVMTIQEVYVKVMEAMCAEDLFGEISGEDEQSALVALDNVYREFTRVIRPDQHVSDADLHALAEEAFERLNLFYNSARRKISDGDYGSCREIGALAIQSRPRIKGVKFTFVLEDKLTEGDLSDIFLCQCLTADEFAGHAVVKVIRDANDNPFARKEIKTLQLLQSDPGKQSKHLPYFLDEFRTNEGQLGVILRRLEAYDLISVREKYRSGIPLEHVFWMVERILSVAGFAHSRGIIHGNIEPSHLLVSPPDHNVFLIDWSYAVLKPAQTGENFSAFSLDFSAPEVKDRVAPIPSADLYSIGKCLVYMLGGNIETNELPDSLDERVARFIEYLLLPSPMQRAQDAWETYFQWQALREKIQGKRKFVPFVM